MIRMVLLLFVGALLAGCQASPSSEATAAPTASIKFDENAVVPGNSVRVMAAGLSCPLCAHNIDASMKQLPGVLNARVDLNSGAVAVTLDGTATVTYGQLAKIVRDNGFTLVGFDPAPIATPVEGGRP